MPKQTPLFVFFLLHAASVWPIGIIGLALGSNLVRNGIAVHLVATIVAATSLAFTLEFLWGPLIDASLTRKTWNVIGVSITFACLLAMFAVPWRESTVALLVSLAFASCSGTAIAMVALKGIMALDVSRERLGAASAFFSAGGTFGKAAGGAIAVLLLAHLSSRVSAGVLCILPAILAAATIGQTARRPGFRLQEFPSKFSGSLRDVWNFIRRGDGVFVAILCVIPFGSGAEAGLMGAISREWAVIPGQLALIATLGLATNIAGVALAGWLCIRIGTWRTYLTSGLAMIALMLAFAVAPRNPVSFFLVELLYRACFNGNYVALLGIVMRAAGSGAASSKISLMWSLTNLSFFYPTLIEGLVHDRLGTTAMLLTDASLGLTGFAIIFLASRLLRSAAPRDDVLSVAEAPVA